MKSGYWRRRALEYEQDWSRRIQSELEPELAKYFKASLSEIEKEIGLLYAKFAKDNKLSYSEARKLIRGAEFKEWRMSLQEYVALSHSDSKILKELNTLAMRSRISRLEKLYSETLMHLQNLGEKYEGAVKDFLTTAYKDRYYHGIYDLAKAGQLAIPAAKVEPVKLEKVLAQRWSGGNYSSRIWKNTEKLSKVLKSTVAQGIHRGLSIQKLSKSLAKEMDVSYKNAERLVRTEMNFISNYAVKESLESAGLEEYEFIAVLDHRTTPRCQALDGTIHLLEEYSVGTNAPPMHPRCRSTISAVEEGGKRVARDSKGRNIKVPAEMKYADYKAVYLDKSLTLANWEIFHTTKIPLQITGLGAAVIPTAKLTQYALNPKKDSNKARAFETALGYNLDNVEKLIENVKTHIDEGEIVEKPDNGYGRRFQITLELIGANGKSAWVLTAWLLDKKTGELRLATIHIDK